VMATAYRKTRAVHTLNRIIEGVLGF
jgi:hypothetical protein